MEKETIIWKEEMIKRIYDVIPTSEYIPFNNILIWDILKYIDCNCFWNDVEDGRTRDMYSIKQSIISLFYHFITRQDEPIDNQTEECIKFVYDLITKQ